MYFWVGALNEFQCVALCPDRDICSSVCHVFIMWYMYSSRAKSKLFRVHLDRFSSSDGYAIAPPQRPVLKSFILARCCFASGSNTSPGWSSHKLESSEYWSFRPHLEVCWSILQACRTHVSWAKLRVCYANTSLLGSHTCQDKQQIFVNTVCF